MFKKNFDKDNYIPNMADAKHANELLINNVEDNALNKLFTVLCPSNTCLEDIIIKISTVNKLYSTNIYNILPVAKHIFHLQIDEKLQKGDPTLINQIANIEINDKHYNYLSFATKYCAFHQPLLYNIYDSNVQNVLLHFGQRDKFLKFHKTQLRDYLYYSNTLHCFQNYYHLEKLNAWQLDKYLWQLGKIVS